MNRNPISHPSSEALALEKSYRLNDIVKQREKTLSRLNLKAGEKVLDLGSHVLCDNLMKIGDISTAEKYPIQVLFCNKCFTAHQACQIKKNLLFPETYHYRARFTKDVINGLNELADSIENTLGNLDNKVNLTWRKR